jgi:hypothetical protein
MFFVFEIVSVIRSAKAAVKITKYYEAIMSRNCCNDFVKFFVYWFLSARTTLMGDVSAYNSEICLGGFKASHNIPWRDNIYEN